MHTRIYGFLLLFCSLCISCNDNKNTNAGKPIVFGDPNTIVTETDSQYLRDFVADVKPEPKEEPKQDTVAVNQSTNNATQPEQARPKQEELKSTTAPKEDNGLTVEFDEVTIFIPRIAVHEGRHSKNKNGATYQLNEGELERNQIRVMRGSVQKISQRIQGATVAKTSMGELQLGATNSNWQPLTGKNNTYLIGNISAGAGKQTPAAIRSAAARAVRAHSKHMHKNMKQKWEAAAQHIHPRDVSTSVRSVIWKIEGKDARGRNYQKQVRVDIP